MGFRLVVGVWGGRLEKVFSFLIGWMDDRVWRLCNWVIRFFLRGVYLEGILGYLVCNISGFWWILSLVFGEVGW